ncbi:TPA: hypothetical protein ACSP88_002530 [Aeromonas hydrophila]
MIDIDSIPVVMPDGSLWTDREEPEQQERTPAPERTQTYAGARRGPKPRSYKNTVRQCVANLALGGHTVARPSLSYCPGWLQHLIIGACRLNGSAGHTGKPLSAGLVFAVMTHLPEISTAAVSGLFNHQYGERYIRMITSAAISACESVKHTVHKLAAHMANATGRPLREDAVEQLLGLAFVEQDEITRDAAEWQEERQRLGMGTPAFIPHLTVGGVQYHQRVDGWYSSEGVKLTAAMTLAEPVEKGPQPLRIQQGLDPHQPPHRTLTMNGKQYRRIIEDGQHVGWQADDGHWLAGPIPTALRKAA